MAIFGTKSWVNPLGKMAIFLSFLTSFIYSQKSRFLVLEYRKRHFPRLYCLKKKDGKMPGLGPKAWVNRFGKMSIFSPLELLLFIALKAVF